MPPVGKKEGESSGDETKKRPVSPAGDNNDSDSLDGNRRSRRKKTRVRCDVLRMHPIVTAAFKWAIVNKDERQKFFCFCNVLRSELHGQFHGVGRTCQTLYICTLDPSNEFNKFSAVHCDRTLSGYKLVLIVFTCFVCYGSSDTAITGVGRTQRKWNFQHDRFIPIFLWS